MRDPGRLSVDPSSDLGHALRGAARQRAPRAAKQRAVAAAAGVFAATTLATGGAAGSAGALGWGAALKWVGVAGVVGLGTMTTVAAIHERGRASGALRDEMAVRSVTPPRPAARPSGAAPAGAPVPAMAPVPLPVPVTDLVPAIPSRSIPAAPAARAIVPAASAEPSLHAELAMLDRARSALDSGDASRALSALGEYGARFPRGSLASEASVLRIDASVRAGDRASARRLATAFVGDHPESPYVAHVRALFSNNP